MSGYPLRSRITKVMMTLDETEATPPNQHSPSVSSATSRQNNAFGRGGLGDESSEGGRGGGGPPTRESNRRERGTNVPRFPRSPCHTSDLESDDISETITHTVEDIEETKQVNEVDLAGAIKKYSTRYRI
jgi:hypothetical protein